MNLIVEAAKRLREAESVICLTGAGVSAESGIPTFREAQTGLWSKFDPVKLASQEGFAADPGLVWRWYMERLTAVEAATPNAGHWALAALAKLIPRFTLVTQNVDDLHERAGHQQVLHLHGRITRFRCNLCASVHPLEPKERHCAEPPPCLVCGDRVRPDVVWFGENLPGRVLDLAWRAAERADVVLVVGTSAVVYPAAQLPLVARQQGAVVIDVNPNCTPISEIADLFLQGESGTLLPQIVDAMTGG
ncbi:MAG: NAD-dependent deacylase [Caldilineaceae bacterium]|nr:NAD-dependent deacylase [Caldilineaceae bacterium]